MLKQKILVVVGAFVIFIGFAAAILWNLSLQDTMDTIEFIAGRYKGSGVYVDYDNSIAVKSAKDIGYWNKGTDWYVKYGKLELKFTKQNLQDPEYLKGIKAIGLDVRGSLEDNSLTWWYEGTQLEEWVPN